MSFASLHTHSEHSHLDGAAKIDEICDRVADLDQPALALTDHGTCEGHYRFFKAARKRGIKPILGMEGYFSNAGRDVREGKKGQNYEHMTLLAMDQQGLSNLWTISSLAWIEGLHYGDPRFDWDLLEQYNAGIIATGGCAGGIVSACFGDSAKRNPEEGIRRIGRLLDIFGDRFFLELHTYTQAKHTNEALVEFASQFDIPLIACTDSHYLYADDWRAHELLVASAVKKFHDDPSRYQFGKGEFHLHSEDEVRKRLGYLPDDIVDRAIAKTGEVADMVAEFEFESKTKLPTVTGSTMGDIRKLENLTWSGFAERMNRLRPSNKQEYEDRLSHELDVIEASGFAGYFLAITDVVCAAKDEGILVGPGRGSACGSLVAYALRITEVDPLRGGLIFERFINPDRVTLPDIDIDFPPNRREWVHGYLRKKYDLAVIGTITKLAPKSLVNEFCRTLRVPRPVGMEMNRLIDACIRTDEKDARFSDAYARRQEEFDKHREEFPLLFDMLFRFDDHIRHAGGHPSGVILSETPLLGQIPMRFGKDEIRTQFDMYDLEELGFVKMDFLGLRNLETLEHAYNFCDKGFDHFYEWQYKWDETYEDAAPYENLWDGTNPGVFQVDTQALSQYIGEFAPRSFEDLVNLVSAFRPGSTRAMDADLGVSMFEAYLQKRQGKYLPRYKHPKLENIIGESQATYIYQEQIMQVFMQIAGYSPSEADRVRRIIGKSKYKEMVAERQTFVERCQENGIDEETANAVFTDVEAAGSYAFNRSHGWAYSMISYWTAWMLKYRPREFMAALLATNQDQAEAYIRECRRIGIPVLGPDVNHSGVDFQLTDEGVIRCGLQKVDGIGPQAATAIYELRPFEDLDDFLQRGTKVNSTAFVNLVRVGGFDTLMNDRIRGESIEEYGPVAESWSPRKMALYRFWKHRKGWNQKVPPIYRGTPKSRVAMDEPFDPERSNFDAWCEEVAKLDDLVTCEREVFGTPLTVDPFGPYYSLIAKNDNYIGLQDMYAGEVRMLGGIIRKRTDHLIQNGRNRGQKMARIWIERPLPSDNGHNLDEEQLAVFSEQYRKYGPMLTEGEPVLVKAEKTFKGGLAVTKAFSLREVVDSA